ncbi:MAG: hypothetical protein BWY11_01917 [Firmicutes bacterium ADurb.Bin182]|nr:MAG: hypothetical protein BWY11_01917 [Firmicutes bacterium ADurb.Bin182]
MIYDKARELSRLLQSSDEYKEFKSARELAMENETTRALINEYHQLQMKVQAAAVTGVKDEPSLERLKKVGEILQFDGNASRYLISEYRLNRILSDVYKILASAVDIDLSALET